MRLALLQRSTKTLTFVVPQFPEVGLLHTPATPAYHTSTRSCLASSSGTHAEARMNTSGQLKGKEGSKTSECEDTVVHLVVDPFCERAFNDPQYSGYLNCDLKWFENEVNEHFIAAGCPLTEGYAPFCKHFFVPNFVGNHLHAPVVPINESNVSELCSGYEARTPEELPVLQRWFRSDDVETPVARYLDVILYSADQICKENEAMGKTRTQTAPWGIVSIKPQVVDYELPMQPITMLRNALGEEEGGSGVPLSREAYRKSVAFWNGHAPVRDIK